MIRSRVISLTLCVIGAGLIWFNPSDQLRDGTRAVSLLTLAGVGALIATRGLVRRIISVIVVLSGLWLILSGTVLCIVAGITVVAGGFIALATSGGWPVMGARYERAAKVEETDLWAALDRGEDPTAR
jgi:hypothetical protein